MSEPPDPGEEIRDWLASLHLPQYAEDFQLGGLRCLEDCGGLSDQRLLELRVFPTGHRRRILRSLEARRVAMKEKEEVRGQRKPVPQPRQIFMTVEKRATSSQQTQKTEQAEDGNSSAAVSPRPPRPPRRKPGNISSALSPSTSSSCDSLSVSSHSGEVPSDWEISVEEETASSSTDPSSRPGGASSGKDQEVFQGDMVTNEIYERGPSLKTRAKGLQPTRSYRLRHRPVPEIPDQVILPPPDCPSYRKKHANTGESVNDDEIPTPPGVHDIYEDEYSTVDECAANLELSNQVWSKAAVTATANTLPRIPVDLTDNISPYACFYGAPKTQFKAGWLDKLSPQGKCVFQKRWVTFDGDNLFYYNNDKEVYSKGLIPCSVMKKVRAQGDNRFEVVTSLRTFVFRAEGEGERQDWVVALRTGMHTPTSVSQKPQTCGAKNGNVELRGYKGRVHVSLTGTRFRLCKSEQDFRAGLGIALVDLTGASLEDTDRRSFEISTPFRNFCFTAESETEKEEWIEAVQEAIAETLSDYEVAEKIWFNQSNRTCADCRAPQPEWASINLGVVICKKCAGQHRFLGPNLSKVRSLKLDSSIWSNELVELFLEVGNKNANSFWAASLPLDEEIHMGATPEQRATFHRRKYRERKYCRVLEGLRSQEELNQALCAAVVLPDVMETMALVYSGADVMCATGDPVCSTPYLLAQRAGQRIQMEFLHHNKLSDFPKLESSSEAASPSDAPSFMDGFLYCSAGPAKVTLDRRGRDDMARRWCTLEGGFLSYYESERTATATGRVDIADVVSLAVNNTETMTGAGVMFTMELYLKSDKVLLFGAKTLETQQDWLQAIAKCFVPLNVEAMLRRGCELIGRLYFKEGHDLYHWRVGWFNLEGSVLYFSSGEEKGQEAAMQLKQLQELTVSTHTEGEEQIQVLLLVEGGRTVYIHGFNKADFALWHSAIQLAAGTDGRALGNQQLTKNGVPIIVDSCIAFVTQYGLCREGVYRGRGDPGRVARLLDAFRQDARRVKLHIQEHQVDDVTDTLKTFLSQAEDALLAKEMYPYWVSALDEVDEKRRVEKYSIFIQALPKVNRSTLAALLQHLYGLQKCSHINQMQTRDLASVFSSCLFQTDGQTPLEVSVVQDLINNYVQLFGVNENQLKQMEKENSFITRWNERKDTTVSEPARSTAKLCHPSGIICVSPSMRSDELAESALVMRNVVTNPPHLWTTFEVIENGELERPLHHKEKVLEQVLEWSSLDDPSSAFLVIKKFGEDKMADAPTGIAREQVKFSDGSSKLLSGHKFQDRYVILRDEKLLLYKEIKSTKPEREISLKFVKCYLGLKRKLKPPTR
uniref:ArfGAP with RhoGAP domain, ankyrin repeat and PH domain 2 n=1 Tax=Esox lucius TaxID=8010 RepID=A0A3P8Y1X1_ESOLU